ncbi:twin-arginine translocase subunit TatC [Pseudohongiella sp. SYSU M77423]|jgi:sec-independent protein translocase protein TatC|uniref:twin-arginine translocase subunit TatC n=1 Tax=unclassified Pseudohongiella TaxID=2629611 RepID=UPI000C8CDC65|nr:MULTISPECIES: twin-arginine translocase subunit TatC [unclassified Pseudohongiella]MAO40151.1 twin-arginine translocase subunit TatC [Pseudohongiella sp.]MDH7942668.1 twin-arginine translocase subunit TatC [Pseudohongiella sp. SYSU M77423]HBX37264.1 twin-arginine translocase subunit TatC [Pseudohongiella sp.]|tara:strand:+ start:402219 stop:402989 length:771 start_codon:yes stop_codon:yes gene_type:complete
MSENTPIHDDQKELSLIGHLVELRDRILKCVAALLLVFLGLVYFANDIYAYVAAPLVSVLPPDTSMIAIDPTSPFFTPFKLTFYAALFVCAPYVLYQLWAFIAPGLYKNEKSLAIPLFVSSVLLFYAGMAFAYFVLFGIVFSFFVSVAPEGIAVAPDIASYLSFVLKIFFAFGFAFEIPIAVFLFIWAGILEPDDLKAKRPYVIVGCFVISMLLTPPDPFTQTILAVPMWMLFETGIYFGRVFLRKKAEQEASENQ